MTLADQERLPGRIRVLELGSFSLLRDAFPDDVTFIDTRFTYQQRVGFTRLGGGVVRRLGRLVPHAKRAIVVAWRRDYDVVVTRCLGPTNSGGRWTKHLGKGLLGWGLAGLTRFARRGKLLVILDMTDHRTVYSRDKGGLKQCDLYFKRELADNLWGSLETQLDSGLCVAEQADRPWTEAVARKLQPISLGIEKVEDWPEAEGFPDKKWDVFYSASAHKMIPAREKAAATMKALEARGLRVFCPDKPLDPVAYRKAMRQSWLCLSPGGFGWDCFRHYEIAASRSCPVITSPTISAYQPYVDGESGYVVDMAEDWTERIVELLKDKQAIEQTTRHAYEHVVAFHSFAALGKYVMAMIEERLVERGGSETAIERVKVALEIPQAAQRGEAVGQLDPRAVH